MAVEGFEHQISSDLAKLIPESVYEDEEKRAEWIDQAIMLGLTQLGQAFTGIETSFVRNEFNAMAREFTGKFIGTESEFNVSLEQFFTDGDSPFVKAFDLDDSSSLICRLLKHRDDQNVIEIKKEREITREAIRQFSNSMLRQQGADAQAVSGTDKGDLFEKETVEFLESCQRFNDSFKVCGKVVIEGTRRKMGDVLATMDDDTLIVMELKSGDNYGQTGEKSLSGQMDASMDYRKAKGSIGSIGVTTRKAMEKKGWQKPFMDIGKNRFIVAVDWSTDFMEPNNFTVLEIAYAYLRSRLSEDSSKPEYTSGIDSDKLTILVEEFWEEVATSSRALATITDATTRLTQAHKEITDMKTSAERKKNAILALISAHGDPNGED
jgi:hypothetical protein